MASNALSPLSPDGAQSRERTPERGEKSERVKRLLGRMAATEAHEQTVPPRDPTQGVQG